ncbi:hypothetical protein DV736_g6590, partial [Chaetothyriales sp. CBS 134916]
MGSLVPPQAPPAGVYVPAVTFFDPEKDTLLPDQQSQYYRYLASTGLTGLVILGTNAETFMLTREERATLLRLARQSVPENYPIIAGVGGHSTAQVLEFVADAHDAGANYLLILPCAYFGKQTTPQVVQNFYSAVAKASPLPILIYNFPAVCNGLDLDSDTITALAQAHPNIVGVKLTCASVGKITRLAATFPPERFAVFGGQSDFLIGGLASGSAGCISAFAQIFPKTVAKIYQLWKAGKHDEALALHRIAAHAESPTKAGIATTKFAVSQYSGVAAGIEGGDPDRLARLLEPRTPYEPRALLPLLDLGEQSNSSLSPVRLSVVAATTFSTSSHYGGQPLSYKSEHPTAVAADTRWIEYTGDDGTVWLNDDRKPSLYTQTFGDCQSDSLINVTRFDASYYHDNMTVQFHLGGSSALTNESLMLYIGVYAYGESRFNLTFNPCSANINSLCPLNSSIPIEANGIIPVSQSDVANIPSIALSIPDFEGQAILRIFANSTQSQISCFSAVITNGASFSHPAAIGTVLGLFALVALVSSVAVAIYGHSVPDTRKHYAHSLSVMVVFAVYQHIFFTGVLSMNWPSVLVAFWSNYAWSAGMIFTTGMQDSINNFIGTNRGNISMVGSVQSGQNVENLGGGYQISQIYRRTSDIIFKPYEGIGTTLRPRALEHALKRRDLVNSTSGFSWYGGPVRPGLPLPGNYSGFAGTLAEVDIPASNAFLTGLVWLLVLTLLITTLMISLKWLIEALSHFNIVKSDRLTFFRHHWITFTAAAVLRTCFLAFFMMMVLTLFQFTLGGPAGLLAIAGLIFSLFFLGMFGLAAYALYSRLIHEKFVKPGDQLKVKRSDTSLLSPTCPSTDEPEEQPVTEQPEAGVVTVSWWQMHFTDIDSEKPHPHDDVHYTTKFGWLASRFRRSKWWFFAFWLVYEFVRACFYGAAAGHALTQVFGLLAWEILAFIAIILLKPFESNRLNLIIVYFLGFSKVATVALSSAFDEKFGLNRILTTVIGIIIIVIQGILTLCLMLAVVLGAISSYMSITRYRDKIKPKSWLPHREKYFKHVDQKATDRPPPPPSPPPRPESPKEPYFAVTSVRREPKIEDEDPHNEETEQQLSIDQQASRGPSGTLSVRDPESNLPYVAPRLRPSWSTLDFHEYDPTHVQTVMGSETSPGEARRMAHRRRAASLRGPSRSGTARDGADTPVLDSRHHRAVSNPNALITNGYILNEEKESQDPSSEP